MNTINQLKLLKGNTKALVGNELSSTGGLLRLAPTWVPRSFLQPGKRLKLDPKDLYAFGLNRGGIDERWFGSTTEAANDNREPDEGLSYCVVGKQRFTLRKAVEDCGSTLVGKALWNKYRRWPVYSKFFDNMGPIPHHMNQSEQQARLVGQEGKPESYYFPPQHNNIGNNFPYTFFGLEPGTTKAQVRKCLEDWNKGDNGILDLSKAYRLKPGTGWLVGPCILHAPGSLCTYEPQWGSDVFGMYQSMVEGRYVPWELLVKDVPKETPASAFEDHAGDSVETAIAVPADAPNEGYDFMNNWIYDRISRFRRDGGGTGSNWVRSRARPGGRRLCHYPGGTHCRRRPGSGRGR